MQRVSRDRRQSDGLPRLDARAVHLNRRNFWRMKQEQETARVAKYGE